MLIQVILPDSLDTRMRLWGRETVEADGGRARTEYMGYLQRRQCHYPAVPTYSVQGTVMLMIGIRRN